MKFKNFIFIFAAFISHSITLHPADIPNQDTLSKRSYPFIVFDNPARLFTMRQFNQNYLSSYRLISQGINSMENRKLSNMLIIGLEFFFLPLTHEEGHRSILVSENIGSVSRPFFNKKGAAYVTGVRDRDLMMLRDNDLPVFVRLHTAGLESDYVLSTRIEELIEFGLEDRSNLYIEYMFRKLQLSGYYLISLFPSLNPRLTEEANELERDIVGHDVYGAVKNLYRPGLEFYRYTDYEDLTKQEIGFVRRAAARSLLNLLNPVFIKPLRIIDKDDLLMSISTGYSMSPFGDFIDENIWIKYHDRYNIHFYLRQYQNREEWFHGFGLRLQDYEVTPKLKSSQSIHLWNQPKAQNFDTSESDFGFSAQFMLKYSLFALRNSNSISIDLGGNYKTFGFLPEEVILDRSAAIRFGMTLNLH